VHDAAHRPARVAAHGEDGAAVPHGDVAVLQGGGDVGAIEEAREARLDLAAQRLQVTPDGSLARSRRRPSGSSWCSIAAASGSQAGTARQRSASPGATVAIARP
jgi:hypothetical protein